MITFALRHAASAPAAHALGVTRGYFAMDTNRIPGEDELRQLLERTQHDIEDQLVQMLEQLRHGAAGVRLPDPPRLFRPDDDDTLTLEERSALHLLAAAVRKRKRVP